MQVNEQEISILVNQYRDKVFRTCMGFVQNTEDADDLTQDVFVAMIEAWPTFRKEAKPETWMYRIAVNKSLNLLRRRKVARMFTSFDQWFTGKNSFHPDLIHDPVQQAEKQEEAGYMLRFALDKLPEKQRIAFTLSQYDDLANTEIAEVMHTTRSAVESLLFRAKQHMIKALQQYRSKQVQNEK